MQNELMVLHVQLIFIVARDEYATLHPITTYGLSYVYYVPRLLKSLE